MGSGVVQSVKHSAAFFAVNTNTSSVLTTLAVTARATFGYKLFENRIITGSAGFTHTHMHTHTHTYIYIYIYLCIVCYILIDV